MPASDFCLDQAEALLVPEELFRHLGKEDKGTASSYGGLFKVYFRTSLSENQIQVNNE